MSLLVFVVVVITQYGTDTGYKDDEDAHVVSALRCTTELSNMNDNGNLNELSINHCQNRLILFFIICHM